MTPGKVEYHLAMWETFEGKNLCKFYSWGLFVQVFCEIVASYSVAKASNLQKFTPRIFSLESFPLHDTLIKKHICKWKISM